MIDNTELNDILKSLQARFYSDETHYYQKSSLSNKVETHIINFLTWIKSSHLGTKIDLRERTNLIFGVDEKGKRRFNASNLYAEIFHDIKKHSNDDTCDYNITCSIKFDITFNRNLTDSYLKHTDGTLIYCDNEAEADIQYGKITLGSAPVLYILYVAPAELIISSID